MILILTLVGRNYKVESDWKTLNADFPSRFNLYGFFSAPVAKEEEDPVRAWKGRAVIFI